jgi:DNA-binding transcriptional LysR family regulator
MRLVAAGVGISVISEVAVQEAVAEGKVLSFPIEGTMPYHLYFVHKKKYLSPEQMAFRDYVLETIPMGSREE